MSYGPPNWSFKTPTTAKNLQAISDSVDWQHDRIPYTADLDGNIVDNADGLAEIVDKVDVDPETYPDYAGHPGSWGEFSFDLPAGMLSSLETVQVQPASGSNGAMTAVVKNETTASITVFVNDPGGTQISPFAIWIYVKGKLNPGYIP
ncbi:MAG: hypothetical protein SWK76_16960 [Actinomycetota bacterium]|nr:hypothetical protein [Actinomycetota bacterium]